MNPSLDISRLEKARCRDTKITARCPACAADGRDKSGVHLFINLKSNQFGCAAHPGDKAHRCEIFRLVGIHRERDPAKERQWRKRRVQVATGEITRRRITAALLAKRSAIIAAHPWSEAEARAESPEQRTEWLHDPRRFLADLFNPSDITTRSIVDTWFDISDAEQVALMALVKESKQLLDIQLFTVIGFILIHII
ncbi:MAG: hypothetical protein WCK77_11760 [Verrucomicrobiota bacterium]